MRHSDLYSIPPGNIFSPPILQYFPFPLGKKKRMFSWPIQWISNFRAYPYFFFLMPHTPKSFTYTKFPKNTENENQHRGATQLPQYEEDPILGNFIGAIYYDSQNINQSQQLWIIDPIHTPHCILTPQRKAPLFPRIYPTALYQLISRPDLFLMGLRSGYK